MKVILVDKIRKLGDLGDIVDVKSGYARNFLIPQQKARTATKENIEHFENIKGELAQKSKESQNAAEIIAEKLTDQVVQIECESNEQGTLFGSVQSKFIVDAIKEQLGVEVDKNQVIIESPLRQIGKYNISIHLYGEVYATVALKINAYTT